jgi:hypothetical protein
MLRDANFETEVFYSFENESRRLVILYEGDVLHFIDADYEKEIFSSDWINNFRELFAEMLKVLPESRDE